MDCKELKPYPVAKPIFVKSLLSFAYSFEDVVFLGGNDVQYPYSGFRNLIAFGTEKKIQSISSLKEVYSFATDWVFGNISYDIKNQLEADLVTNNPDPIGFEELYFFIPEFVIEFFDEGYCVHKGSSVFLDTLSFSNSESSKIIENVSFSEISRSDYLEAAKQLMDHIQRGDIYELNYCIQFSGVFKYLDPIAFYLKVMEKSPAPFSSFYKQGDKVLICASPERFLKKDGKKLISQPIKGTSSRFLDQQKDIESKEKLRNSSKEIAENVMITDLVRNDLSHFAAKGSVKVEELCGIYSFKHVHQMISTIVADLENEKDALEALFKAFPMGSMTGAPKINAMQLIEKFETFKRGLFSGSVGYIAPNGDFDFNVVIRSALVNMETNKIVVNAGSALTHYCDINDEFDECNLKIGFILDVIKELATQPDVEP